ncbi:MAG: SdpI family protein [Planctomycetia bacterium]|nr:SdpI family protein [Planctomycetia bacterium]
MRANWRSEVAQLILIATMFAATAILWPVAPNRMPVHWNLAGQPDRYGRKFEGLLVAPLTALGLYLMFLVLPRIDPLRSAYAAFARPYAILRVATIALIAVVHAIILLVAFGYKVDVGLVVPLAVGILLCIIGNFMGKFRPNWFVGVRTPWTLSSRASWNKTHRLAGRMFIATGIALGIFAFVQSAWMLCVVLAMVALMVVVLPVYSYVVWRHDPERLRSVESL